MSPRQHLRLRLVELLLVQRKRDRRERNEDDRLDDDPLPPPDDVQVVPQRRRVARMPRCQKPSPIVFARSARIPVAEPPYCGRFTEPAIGPWSYSIEGYVLLSTAGMSQFADFWPCKGTTEDGSGVGPTASSTAESDESVLRAWFAALRS